MAIAVEAAVAQYRRSTVDQFEVSSSALRNACTKESVMNGQTATFLVAGSGTDVAVTRGVNGQIPYGNPTNTQKTATLVEKHAPYELTNFNIFASQGDQKEVMRKASMNVINRDIDLTILAELANATIDTGAVTTASVAWVLKAKAYLGNNAVRVNEEDNMFAIVTDSVMAYLAQTTEFSSRDYVDDLPYKGGIKRVMRWMGINWLTSPLCTGVGTSTELCYMFHREAIGYAVNVGEDSIDIGYDGKQNSSWSRATVFHGAKILQNTGIVQLKHDGSAFGLS
jgi:hypothetical protein